MTALDPRDDTLTVRGLSVFLQNAPNPYELEVECHGKTFRIVIGSLKDEEWFGALFDVSEHPPQPLRESLDVTGSSETAALSFLVDVLCRMGVERAPWVPEP